LSDANKLLIRCAWVGNSAFLSAGHGSGWGSGTCPATFNTKFNTKDSLQTAVQAYNTNPTAATETYSSIARWDVSMITDMSYLFSQLKNFNADISSWDTSKVTNMQNIFYVRSARALAPNSLESVALPVHAACAATASRPLPLPGPHLAPHRMPLAPFDLAASVGVQPAAALGHLQGHDHAIHVQRALRACPGPQKP